MLEELGLMMSDWRVKGNVKYAYGKFIIPVDFGHVFSKIPVSPRSSNALKFLGDPDFTSGKKGVPWTSTAQTNTVQHIYSI